MPVTITYDLANADTNQRNYIRSAFERFGWKQIGGSVLRYRGRSVDGGDLNEDWLNDVVPALMFFRSYVKKKGITLRKFTLDAFGESIIDHSEAAIPWGNPIEDGAGLPLVVPANAQSSEAALRAFVTSTTAAAP